MGLYSIVIEGIVQSSEHRLRFFRRRWVRLVPCTGRESPQPEENQGVRQGPAFRNIILDGDIAVAQTSTGHSNALDDLLDARLVNEVVESELVRVLEFEFVIVCQ